MSQSTPALPAFPQPPEKPAATHETIDVTGCGEAMKAALHAVLDGTPYRDAAREVGLASHQDLHRAAKKLGLLEIHTARLVEGCKRIADLANAELERRLLESPETISTKDLSVAGGIALDKVAKYEGWDRNRDSSNLASVVADRISALEGKVSLTVTLERSPSAIDVTPSKTSA